MHAGRSVDDNKQGREMIPYDEPPEPNSSGRDQEGAHGCAVGEVSLTPTIEGAAHVTVAQRVEVQVRVDPLIRKCRQQQRTNKKARKKAHQSGQQGNMHKKRLIRSLATPLPT
jgi:hypothetical protein